MSARVSAAEGLSFEGAATAKGRKAQEGDRVPVQALTNNATVCDVPSAWDSAVGMVFHHRLWQSFLNLSYKTHIVGVQTPETNYFKSTCRVLGALFQVYFIWLRLLAF